MMQAPVRPAHLLLAASAAAALLVVPVGARQSATSATPAKELAGVLEKAQLDAIAAPMPNETDVFVAAMHIPGQLLVVSAKYAAPSLLREKIDKKQYRDVYVDLNSASVPNTRTFIEDLNADGLVYEPEENLGFDTYDNAGKSIGFDGDWRKRKMSEDEYRKAFTEADQAYAQMLAALLAQARASGTE
jgi:hypothetical protein